MSAVDSNLYLKQLVNSLSNDLSIAGDVNVSNFPATQPISGTVTVSNFPGSALGHLDPCIDQALHNVQGDIKRVNGQPWSLGPGTRATVPDINGCPRVCIATDDQNTAAINTNTGTIAGAVSSSKMNVNISSSAITQAVSGTIAVSNFPATQTITGNVTEASASNILTEIQRLKLLTVVPQYLSFLDSNWSFRKISQGWIWNTNNAASGNSTARNVTEIIVNSGAAFQVELYTTFCPPYDGSTIVTDNANDVASTGTNARTVLFEYYDDTWIFRSVTHNLGAATTYNIRKIVKFEVNSWGATKYNAGPIYLKNGSNYSGLIFGNNNTAGNERGQNMFKPICIEIPFNGFVLLSNVEFSSALIGKVYVYLVKKTASTMICYEIFSNWCNNGQSFNVFDLSSLGLIYGPTDLTESWCICMACIISSASASVAGLCINAKCYKP